MSERFAEFVKHQVESSKSSQEELDLKEEKEMWLAKLDELYELIRRGLANYIADGSISLEFLDISLSEDQLGTYPVKLALITVGKNTVRLEPIGTFLIGSRGRVDMTGPRGMVRLTIVPPSARAPQVRVTIVRPGEPAPQDEPLDPPETWVWKIATPPPRITYIDLTEDSFQDALMGVING